MYTEEEKKELRGYMKNMLPVNANKQVQEKLKRQHKIELSRTHISLIRNLKSENAFVLGLFLEMANRNYEKKLKLLQTIENAKKLYANER